MLSTLAHELSDDNVLIFQFIRAYTHLQAFLSKFQMTVKTHHAHRNVRFRLKKDEQIFVSF